MLALIRDTLGPYAKWRYEIGASALAGNCPGWLTKRDLPLHQIKAEEVENVLSNEPAWNARGEWSSFAPGITACG